MARRLALVCSCIRLASGACSGRSGVDHARRCTCTGGGGVGALVLTFYDLSDPRLLLWTLWRGTGLAWFCPPALASQLLPTQGQPDPGRAGRHLASATHAYWR